MLRSVLAGVVVLCVSMISTTLMADTCQDSRVAVRGANGQSSFTVELADTDPERALGLMHRESMPRFSGMLFVFDAPQRAVFWMENTLISLDMLFADDTGVVQHVHHNAIPLDRTGIDGGSGIRYVLEINGGMAQMLGLEAGAELRHPAINQETAAWPCN